MGKKRDLSLMEEEATRLEQKAKEVRQQLARFKREETERRNAEAGQKMRRLWAEWEWVTIEEVETALTEIFGPRRASPRQARSEASAKPAVQEDDADAAFEGQGTEHRPDPLDARTGAPQ